MAKKTKDAGHDETEKVLAEIEKRIAKEYSQAEEEVAEKLDKYMKRFEAKDKKKQKDLKAGLISQSEYDQWKVGQIAMGRRWEELRQNLAEDFTHADQIARSITGDYMPEVYAINHNYGTYQIEKGTRINTNYTLYDAQTVERLADVNDDIIPVPGKKLSKAIKEGKAVRWNNQQIQSVMMQSILQGESIPNIAKRLSREVGEKDRKAAVRNARTLTTGVQNRGRVDSYKRAQKLGIDLEQQWVATLDGRTRHEHRLLDGQAAPVGGKFKVEGYEIEYPGDPTAPGHLIYNCRCTLIPSIKGWEFDLSDRSLRYDDKLGDMTYEDWKYEHLEYVSDRKQAEYKLGNMFNKVDPDIKSFDEELLIANTNQLITLDKKFGIIGGAKRPEFGTRVEGNPRAFGSYSPASKDRWKLNLNKRYYSNYHYFMESNQQNWVILKEYTYPKMFKMPCDVSERPIYTVTHEYGHALEFDVIYKRNRDRLRGVWNSDVMEEQATFIRGEIIDIAIKNNPDFIDVKALSEYGETNEYEFFAECFVNSQLSQPNELGMAMREWLKKEGFPWS